MFSSILSMQSCGMIYKENDLYFVQVWDIMSLAMNSMLVNITITKSSFSYYSKFL
jgi:hypothetical protein